MKKSVQNENLWWTHSRPALLESGKFSLRVDFETNVRFETEVFEDTADTPTDDPYAVEEGGLLQTVSYFDGGSGGVEYRARPEGAADEGGVLRPRKPTFQPPAGGWIKLF